MIVLVRGGIFEGPLKGKVFPGGVEFDVRGTMQTDDGALIYASYRGYISKILKMFPRWVAGEQIPHEEYYFAAIPYFETSASQYAWLQQVVVIGMGFLIPGGVGYHLFAVR